MEAKAQPAQVGLGSHVEIEMMFASSFSGKWGDYDPDGMDEWEK